MCCMRCPGDSECCCFFFGGGGCLIEGVGAGIQRERTARMDVLELVISHDESGMF